MAFTPLIFRYDRRSEGQKQNPTKATYSSVYFPGYRGACADVWFARPARKGLAVQAVIARKRDPPNLEPSAVGEH
jgi:hypothetical protein